MDFSFVIFLCKRFLFGQTKRRRTLLAIFRLPGYSNPLAYYILHKFPTPLLIRLLPFIRDYRVRFKRQGSTVKRKAKLASMFFFHFLNP